MKKNILFIVTLCLLVPMKSYSQTLCNPAVQLFVEGYYTMEKISVCKTATGTPVKIHIETQDIGPNPIFKIYKNYVLIKTTIENSFDFTINENSFVYVEMINNRNCNIVPSVFSRALSFEVIDVYPGSIDVLKDICMLPIPVYVVPQQLPKTFIGGTISNSSTYSYTWETSLDGIYNWSIIPNETNDYNYRVESLPRNSWVRRVVLDANLDQQCSAISNSYHLDGNYCTSTPSPIASNSDFPSNAKSLVSNIINIATTNNFIRTRNISASCTTSATDTNTIDAFYTFIADNSNVSLDLNVGNSAWLSTMELLDTFTYQPISNSCQSNIGVGLSTRTYNFTGLTVGQKYLVRLELGDIAPLGHARMSAVDNTFGVKLNSIITDISDNTSQSNKTISNIYNLQGLEVSKDFRGLVIYKYSDGTTQKVVQE